MTQQEQLLAKIKQVVMGAAQFNDEQFRLILEGLVKKGKKEAELLLVQFMTTDSVDADIRENIIRCTGYIQSVTYMIPLKNLIEQEPRLPLKKAAVLALAKYNSQKAISILNTCLQNIGNPFLQNTIKEQISMIKKNNPILGLLPRFLKGDQDKKSFMVVTNLLKKLLNASDTTIFINYLKSEDMAIRNASLDLLCCNGDRSHQTYILDFFYQRLHPEQDQSSRNAESETQLPPVTEDEANVLANHVKTYFLRFPTLILTQLRRLNALYAHTGDPRIRKIVITILCHSKAPQALTFIKQIYDSSEPELKELIIEESTGNEQAVDFLFERYQAGQSLKGKVIKALLSSQKGFEYFSTRFNEFDEDGQELIVKGLPNVIRPRMVPFIKTIFQSEHQHLKTYLLKRIRDNFLYNFREVLFDSQRLDELFKMESEYIRTIAQLFPVSTVKLLLDKIATSEMEVAKAKRFMEHIIAITKQGVVVTIKDNNLLELLVLKVINASSLELNDQFLTVLEQIKTLDRTTYKNLYDASNFFTLQRGDNLVEEETYSMKRVKDNLKNIIEDVRKGDALEKELKMVLAKSIADLNRLRQVLVNHHMGVAFRIKWVVHSIAEYMKHIDPKYMASWREFFSQFPLITQMVREARSGETGQDGGSLHDTLRITIRFEDRSLTALFKDQFKELLPHFNIVIDALQLEPTDILLCDSHSLKEYINSNTLTTKRVFVLLENRSEYNAFKALNPKSFIAPISVYRTVKLILSELYITHP
ncbi:MAG: HEAT repeat domain-containing protein [bacterium]|nr:HEAT repeat domain-containing protein [bacterium]